MKATHHIIAFESDQIILQSGRARICQSNCDRPATHWLESEKIYLCDICTEHHLRFELPGIPERIVLTEYNKHFEYNLTTQ